MKKRYFALILGLLLLILSCGCQRRLMPGQQAPDSQFRISTISDRSEFYYGTVTITTTAQTGSSETGPTNYTVLQGSQVRITDRYDDNYVVILPNNQRGLMPTSSVIPSTQEGITRLGSPGTPAGAPGNPPSSLSGIPGTLPGNPTITLSETSGNNMTLDTPTMISLINKTRVQAGLKPLVADGSLMRLANMKARDMAASNYFSHTSPTYGSAFDMMKNNGVSYLYAGENLAIHQTVEEAEQVLMNSPHHKANILNPKFTDIGIGIVQKSDGSHVYVQEFIGR